MKKGLVTKNIIGGKWISDRYNKKIYTKICNRKIREEGKKLCKNYDID